jgi:hypothetical protein
MDIKRIYSPIEITNDLLMVYKAIHGDWQKNSTGEVAKFAPPTLFKKTEEIKRIPAPQVQERTREYFVVLHPASTASNSAPRPCWDRFKNI